MRRFVPLATESDAERFIDAVVPGVYAAGTPYDDWLFGGADEARAALADAMRRPTSEVFIGRATLCLVDDVVIGGVIPLAGEELAACRVADALATLRKSRADRRMSMAKRIDEARNLFPSVAPDDFYLSRVWVSPHTRGTGHGVALVREYLATGRRQGFTRFRADICSKNTGVLRLAQFLKFETLGENASEDAAMTYVSVLRDESDQVPMTNSPEI
jgi:GNAT superfamily N-acetyltransferase